MKKITPLALSLLVVAVLLTAQSIIFTVRAQAASLTPTQIQAVISLLQAFGVDSEIISSVQSTLSGSSIVATSTTSSTVLITGDSIGFLCFGNRGNGVKILQIVLAADSSIYPEGIISGYFGPLTQRALKRYQEKHGLEQVGFIGPRTLEKLKNDLGENQIGTEDDNDSDNENQGIGIGNRKRLCAVVPPGHLIAPGWLKKQGGVSSIVPACQVLPPGIAKKLGGQTTPTPTPDIAAPTLSSISASAIALNTATVSWVTDEAATGKVYYATTSPLDLGAALSVADNALVTSHSLNLTGLTASTTYYFAVESKDAADNIAASSEQSFVTLESL